MNSNKKYLTVHNLKQLEKKEFSIIIANIQNSEEKRKIAERLYEKENYYIEFHNYRQNLKVMN